MGDTEVGVGMGVGVRVGVGMGVCRGKENWGILGSGDSRSAWDAAGEGLSKRARVVLLSFFEPGVG